MAAGTTILRGMARLLPSRALRPFGRPAALYFHGVERQISDPRIQFNQHSMDGFYKIAKALKTNFQVLPLSALPDALKRPEQHTRTAFLMSDDGYRNTLTNAADILDGLGLPWTLFVSTHHIDSGELNPLTAARLFFHFAPAARYVIPNFAGAIVLEGAETRRKAAAHGIKALRALEVPKARQAVDAMSAALPAELRTVLLERFASERFLNWSQVAELARRGVEIGSHAHLHWPMQKGRTAEELGREAVLSRQRIEHQIGACRVFAYPFGNTGDVSREAWHAVREAGYAHAFTTLAGTLDGGANPWLLPRYGLHPEEGRLGSLVPMLRAGNARLARWQQRIA